MKIIAIVAIAKNGAIGKNNRLLWRLGDDMKFFKLTTMGHTVVTGRKNYESIPDKFRPLPQRHNIVITRQPNYPAPGAIVVHSLEEALQEARKLETQYCYIIGGGEIYREALQKDLFDELLVTHVDREYEGDVFFPLEELAVWEPTKLASHSEGNGNDAAFTIVSYKKR
jgi:dihydrofolate reductase